MGTLDDASEVLVGTLGDGGLQAIAILEDIVTDTDTAGQFPAIISVAIVFAMLICLIIRWVTSDTER
jgi:hypothetical protein